jgi:hypothetical protein
LVSKLTALSLLFIWLAALVLACAAVAYFVASIQMRRMSREELASPERAADMRALASRIATGLEIAGAIFFVVLVAGLALNAVQLFRLNQLLNSSSEGLAHRFIGDEYQAYRISPQLAFALTDDWTVGGVSPHVGDSVVVTAKLMARAPSGTKCDAAFLRNLAAKATPRLDSPDLKVSASPTLDDTHACFVAWRWIAVAQHAGISAAVVDLAIRDGRGAVTHVSKPLHFAVPNPPEAAALIPSITSFAVALLSILGALLTRWLNSRSAKPIQADEPAAPEPARAEG